MALAILSGSALASSLGTGASSTFTYTNASPCVMVATIHTFGVGGYVGITSVTDSAGVTWNRRSRKQFISNYTGFSGLDHITVEVWWADLTTTHGSPVTVTIAKSNTGVEGLAPKAVRFGVTGSPSPATPWLGGAYNQTTYSSAAGTASGNLSLAYAALNLGDMVLSHAHEITHNSGAVSTPGQTSTASLTVGTTNKVLSATEHLFTSAASESGNMTWTGGVASYIQLVDILVASGTGSSGEEPAAGATASGATITITTSLIAGTAAVTEEAALVSVTTSVIGGTAGTAGDLIVAAISIIPGGANVTEEANVVTVTTSLLEGTAGTAGSLISVQLFLIAGTAFELGAHTSAGALFTLLTELIPGSAVSGGQGLGSVMPVTISLIAGTASVSGQDGGSSGSTLTVFTSLIDGQATGQIDATAPGDILLLSTSLVLGSVDGGVGVLTIGMTLIPGIASGGMERVVGGNPFVHVPVPPTVHARAQGATMTTRAHFQQGTVVISNGVVEKIVYVEVEVPSIVVPVSSTTNVTATGHAVIQSLLVAAGQATGDAIAFGAQLDAKWDYGPSNEMIMETSL